MKVSDAEKSKKCRAILGVPENAGAKALRKAYHEKVLKLHPDAHPGDPMAAEAFKRINVAYEFLKKSARAAGGESRKEKEISEIRDTEPVEHAAKNPEPPAPREAASEITMEELIFRLKNSQNVYVRIHAARAIGAAGDKESVWALLQALRDKSPSVALETVAALGNMKARLAVLPLIGLYKESDDVFKTHIEWALEKIASPVAVRFLEEIGAVGNKSEGGSGPAAGAYRGMAADLLNA